MRNFDNSTEEIVLWGLATLGAYYSLRDSLYYPRFFAIYIQSSMISLASELFFLRPFPLLGYCGCTAFFFIHFRCPILHRNVFSRPCVVFSPIFLYVFESIVHPFHSTYFVNFGKFLYTIFFLGVFMKWLTSFFVSLPEHCTEHIALSR